MRARVEAPAGLIAVAGGTLTDVDFRRAAFEHFLSGGCTFIACDFRGMTLDAKFQPLFGLRRQSVFRACRFDGTDLRVIDPGQSRFEACSFDGARIDGWRGTATEFVDCAFSGPIVGVRFYGRPWGTRAHDLDPRRTMNAFRGNDFSAAQLVDTLFVMGIDVAAQRWPSGPEYIRLDRIHHRITRAHSQIVRWKDLDERKEALALLEALSERYGHQTEIFTRRGTERSDASAAVEDRVWEILARPIA